MSDMGSEPVEQMLKEVERENLRLIFDRDKSILSDEDYARLSKLVDDESIDELTVDTGEEFAQ